MDITFLHFCEDVFTEPYVFRPERWLEPDAEKLEELLIPFSRGPRSCPGMKYAPCPSLQIGKDLRTCLRR